MVAAASVGIVTWISEWISELGPTMGSAVTDARFFTYILRGPNALETVKKNCFCCSVAFGVTVRDEPLFISQIILTVSPSKGDTESFL